MRKLSAQYPAFTFLEILIVITIMMLLLGSGIAAYITFADTQQMRAAAKEVQSYLRLAQKKARAGERPEGCTRLDAFRVKTVATQSILTISAVCRSQEYLTETYTLSNSIEFKNTQQVDFVSLQGGVVGAGTITLQNDTREYSFEVGAGGDITQGEFVR